MKKIFWIYKNIEKILILYFVNFEVLKVLNYNPDVILEAVLPIDSISVKRNVKIKNILILLYLINWTKGVDNFLRIVNWHNFDVKGLDADTLIKDQEHLKIQEIGEIINNFLYIYIHYLYINLIKNKNESSEIGMSLSIPT